MLIVISIHLTHELTCNIFHIGTFRCRQPETTMPFARRHLMQFAAATLATLALGAAAQTYPAKPVTLMVPYPAGGL